MILLKNGQSEAKKNNMAKKFTLSAEAISDKVFFFIILQ